MKARALPLGVCLVVDRVSGQTICTTVVGVSELPSPPSLAGLLPNGAGYCLVSGPLLLLGVIVSS